jgi:hypothetical protein
MPLLMPAPYPENSVLPAGGRPAWDDEFMAWVRAFVATANTRWIDRHFPTLPDRELVHEWRVVNHLVKWCVGFTPPGSGALNHNHRIRLVAVQHHHRPHEVEAEAARYVDRLARDRARDA